MSPHSHLNPVPGDTYSWSPQAPYSADNLPLANTWKKILCQPTMHADQSGRLLRRILSITNTDPPQMARDCPAAQPPPTTLVELTPPPPTAYVIYVDGGWDTVNADFTTAFQEQRDSTNRRGSAGTAIFSTGPDWMNKGTILITLHDGSQK
jgi:hypothetical protein